MSIAPGRLITLEGGEGLGKTTQLETVRAQLAGHGIEVVVTREPGGTPLGERLRELLLDPELTIDSDSELLMMFAARACHLTSLIRPALERGAWVVCDRFTDASYAYQGGGRGLAYERIATVEEWVLGELRPDLVLLFDAPVGIGMERARQRATLDRFERQGNQFLERVRAAYLARAESDPGRYRLIDAAAALPNVTVAVNAAVESLLADYRATDD